MTDSRISAPHSSKMSAAAFEAKIRLRRDGRLGTNWRIIRRIGAGSLWNASPMMKRLYIGESLRNSQWAEQRYSGLKVPTYCSKKLKSKGAGMDSLILNIFICD